MVRNRSFGEAVPGLTCLVAASGLTAVGLAQTRPFENPPANPGTQTLAANDDWAATSPGTTAGSVALPANIYTVTNLSQPTAALNNESSTLTLDRHLLRLTRRLRTTRLSTT